MQGQQLLTESQVFDDEVFPRTKSRDNPSEDIPEHDHGKNLIGTVGIETFAKSLILRVYDVLARHKPDLIVGLGIVVMNADAAREVYTTARAEHRAAVP